MLPPFSVIAMIGTKKRLDLQNKRSVIGGEQNVGVKFSRIQVTSHSPQFQHPSRDDYVM